MSEVNIAELLPWQQHEYEGLLTLDSQKRLAHAYLLEGVPGLGKLTLALTLAHYFLCESPKGSLACKACRSCRLVAAKSHPDLKLVVPVDSKNIRIDQIRSSIEFLANTSHQGGKKIVIISPSEAMNINSANALLKALEEPAAGVLLLLVSHQPSLLLATIRSRCQKVKLKCPERSEAHAWLKSKQVEGNLDLLLKLASGAPLKALSLADEEVLDERETLHETLLKLHSGEINIVQASINCGKFTISNNIDGMMLCVIELLALLQSNQKFLEQDRSLQKLAEQLQLSKNIQAKNIQAKDTQAEVIEAGVIQGLHHFYSALLMARKALVSNTNPNPQLLLEGLFYQWLDVIDGNLFRQVDKSRLTR